LKNAKKKQSHENHYYQNKMHHRERGIENHLHSRHMHPLDYHDSASRVTNSVLLESDYHDGASRAVVLKVVNIDPPGVNWTIQGVDK